MSEVGQGVVLTLDGPVATVTLAAPERRNAQTPAFWRALAEVGRSLPSDTRAVILRAEGVSFSAGLDRRMLTVEGVPGEPSVVNLGTRGDAEIDATIAGYQEAFTWWRRPDILSVAAVQGHAVGAGFQLALACHLRVLADDAVFSMRETQLGLVPDLCGTKPLVDLVGPERALEICLTGRWVTADEAVRIGLAVRTVPREELDAAVSEIVDAVLAAPPGAVTETIDLLSGAGERSYDEQLQRERQAQTRRLRELVHHA